MTPVETVAAMYRREGLVFREVLEAHLLNGYVFSGPDWFVMGRAVDGNDSTHWLDFTHSCPAADRDAWLVTAFAGDLRPALRLFPYPLPWVLWQRFGRDNRWHRVSVESLCTRAAPERDLRPFKSCSTTPRSTSVRKPLAQ